VRPASATVGGYGSLAPILEKKRGLLGLTPQKARYQNAKARVVEDSRSTVGSSAMVIGKVSEKVRKSRSKVKKKSNFEVMAEQDQKVAGVQGDKMIDNVLMHQTDFKTNLRKMMSADQSAEGDKELEK
jgi:hypothetical protein